MSWNQDLRCTSQEANPSPIHLFKILLPKFIHRVVFHYITQIIIFDFKDFRMKHLEDKSRVFFFLCNSTLPSNQGQSTKIVQEVLPIQRIHPYFEDLSYHFLYLLLQFRFKETIVSHSLERYEWDRWVLWSVEILGYIKNGVCLEDEFGVPMNSYVVNLFIQQVRDGNWDESITTLYCILV